MNLLVSGERLQKTMGTAARAALAAVALWLGLGSPSAALLEGLLPAQRWIYGTLMPDHRVLNFELRQLGPQLSLVVRSQTSRYIVVSGHAYAPGVDFEANTPARAGLLVAMVVAIGGVLALGGRPSIVATRATLYVAAAFLLATCIPPVVLAGAQWGLAYRPFEDLSLPALLVGSSDFLLHGGGLAIGAAFAWAFRTRKKQTTS
ncbi:MAG: hypothetical protein EKK52_20490 [Burkholderiales bacterium]|nr:MAG: hypothetical protein EKK52_20490 [Burkholderiales bacterium]